MTPIFLTRLRRIRDCGEALDPAAGTNLVDLCCKLARRMLIPFLFLTGLDDRRDMHATADLHPTEYLTKPIDLAVLISKIRKLTKTD